ncbi:MAG: aminotransferase class IV [Caulobacteraceae bacterium]
MAGSQDYAVDPRNADVRVWLNGELVPRAEATVSIFDAGFCMGDGVWEGLRLHKGGLLFLDAHLDRLFAGARAIALNVGLDPTGLKRALADTLDANAMIDGVHVRLMVTRGVKSTPSQDPRNAVGPATVAIVAEHKRPLPPAGGGLALACVAQRCTPPSMFDMRLNSHSRLNLIVALLQAIEVGGDEALMLDPNGFVSSCNATNFFVVRGGEILTSRGDYCFNGITRGHVIDLCLRERMAIRLADFTLAEAGGADEAFVTGTMGGITPVRRIDNRDLPASPGPVTKRLQELYEALKDVHSAASEPP